MTSLRTVEGLDLRKISLEFGPDSHRDRGLELLQVSRKFIEEGKLIKENNFLKLTQEGKLFADGIAAELFLSELPTTNS
jgi:oxygen-independent coproporphyrinogen-3 oxidase